MRRKSKIVFERLHLHLIVVILFANVVAGIDLCTLSRLWYFQNVVDILTLEATGVNQITVQPSDPFAFNSSQLFSVECASRPGLFYLVNNATGKILDVERYVGTHRPHVFLADAIDQSLWQQWFLDDLNMRVVNAAYRFAIAIEDSNFVPGAAVVVEPIVEGPSQRWITAEVQMES